MVLTIVGIRKQSVFYNSVSQARKKSHLLQPSLTIAVKWPLLINHLEK